MAAAAAGLAERNRLGMCQYVWTADERRRPAACGSEAPGPFAGRLVNAAARSGGRVFWTVVDEGRKSFAAEFFRAARAGVSASTDGRRGAAHHYSHTETQVRRTERARPVAAGRR